MEINISAAKNLSLWGLSGSILTHGTNAAQETFNQAQDVANEVCLLDTPEKLKAYRNHLRQCGMDETEEMSDLELNAVLLQEISIELRENDMGRVEEIEFYGSTERMFLGIDGEFYFYCGF